MVINSVIQPNMQYRRPSDTFVQWFDSQHILYGLNLTSVTDAEGFEREFEFANGKRTRTASNVPTSGAQSSAASNTAGASPAAVTTTSAKPTPSGTISKSSSGQLKQSSTFTVDSLKQPSISEIAGTLGKTNIYNTGAGGATTGASAGSVGPSASGLSSDMKQVNILKSRIKELELQNLSLDADRSTLNETIASQSKTISGLQNQIKQLEGDVDKLKSAFQQNTSSVNIWKQQLQTYQEVNESLTNKITEISELYDKIGDVLRRD